MTNESTKVKVPIVEGLFTWPSDNPRLIASRCKKCGTVVFPKMPFCNNPDCEKKRENVEEILLNKKGKIFTYTYQIYAPKEPFKMEPFEPYGMAMIDFPEGVRLLGMCAGGVGALKIGMDVEIMVGRLYEDKENEYITYMFKPLG